MPFFRYRAVIFQRLPDPQVQYSWFSRIRHENGLEVYCTHPFWYLLPCGRCNSGLCRCSYPICSREKTVWQVHWKFSAHPRTNCRDDRGLRSLTITVPSCCLDEGQGTFLYSGNRDRQIPQFGSGDEGG